MSAGDVMTKVWLVECWFSYTDHAVQGVFGTLDGATGFVVCKMMEHPSWVYEVDEREVE